MTRITNWISQYPNSNTKMAYASSVYLFLAHVYNFKKEKKITQKHLEKYEQYADQYFTEGRDYTNDLIQFAGSFEGKPPKTAKSYISSVKEFLIFNDVEIKEKDARAIKRRSPKGGARTIEREMGVETLRSILNHCDIKMRALILLLASSGMRIGEALTLRKEDIDISGTVGVINVRAETTKTKIQRYTFCSHEACEIIREWLKKRDAYLKETQNKGRGLNIVKSAESDLLFPFSDTTVSQAWENALRAAGLHSRDPVTNRLQIHIHMLRKFFSSQLRIVVPVDIVEGLMGHSGYLSDAYRRYTKQQVTELYLKGEPYLTILAPEDFRELRTNVDQRLNTQAEIVENVVRKNINLEKDVTKMRNELSASFEILQTIANDPSMISTLKDMFAIVKQVKENPKLLQKMSRVIER